MNTKCDYTYTDDVGLALTPSVTLYEQVEHREDTGLLDQYGNRLFRITKPNPIGFLHDRVRRQDETNG